jgi:hypothetical protein
MRNREEFLTAARAELKHFDDGWDDWFRVPLSSPFFSAAACGDRISTLILN